MTAPMDAVDISNNTTHFTAGEVQQWKAEGIGLAIIQLIGGVRLAGEDCATQIQTCLDGGLAVDCYLFPGNDGLPLTTADRLALVPDDLKPRIRQLWIDVEPAYQDPDKAAIDQAHSDCDAWAPWQRTGDYSALWVADKMGWHPWPWPDRKQWLVYVLNSGARNLGGGFDGTDMHALTQYQMDVMLAGVSGMDRSALTDAEAQAVTDWLNGGNVADCVELQQKVDGFATTIADMGDRIGDLILAECSRPGGAQPRKAVIRGYVAQLHDERVQAVGPRP